MPIAGETSISVGTLALNALESRDKELLIIAQK